MDKRLMRYYRRELHGGRSMLAYLPDFLLLRAIMLLCAYLLFRSKHYPVYVALLLGMVLTLLLSAAIGIINSIRLERVIKNKREAAKKRHMQNSLLFMPNAQFRLMAAELCDEDGINSEGCVMFALQRAQPLSADAVLCCYRAAVAQGACSAAIFSSTDLSAEATELINRVSKMGFKFHCQCGGELCERRCGIEVSDDEADSLILDELTQAKASFTKKYADWLLPARSRPYLLLGIALLAASFFLGFSLYYRIIGCLCLSLAAAVRLYSLRTR